MLGCVNRSVVRKARLSPANIAAASAAAADLMWAQHSSDKGLQLETAAATIRDLADELYEEGVKESGGLIYRTDGRGSCANSLS